jgi:hypothetical protein
MIAFMRSPAKRVLHRQVEARRARVALAARAAAQLVVDPARLVPLGADDLQPPGADHVVVQRLPLLAQLADARGFLVLGDRGIRLDELHLLLDVAAEHDVGAAARHVGGDGDHLRPAGLRDDLGLPRVLLGVQHLVRQVLLLQQAGEQFGVLDRRGADQHRLAARVAVLDVLEDGVVLLLQRAEDLVLRVDPDHRAVRRDDHRLEPVDLLELVGLGVRRARHAGELAVHAEVVLERDRRVGLVLRLDLDALLRLDGLVQALGPAAADHQAAGELVDDDHFAVLHDVLLVAVEQRVRAQRRVEVVHQDDVARRIEALALRQQSHPGQDAFELLVPGLGDVDLVRLLVDPEIAVALLVLLARQQLRHLVHANVGFGVVLGGTRDDQRRARLVDQDRVDLVDDRVGESALPAVRHGVLHVVAQVVEPELVVRPVGDVGRIGGALVLGRLLADDRAHGHSEEAVDAPHPVGVARDQVVVDGDHVHALAGQRVQVDRERRGQGLALAGAHLGDLAVVQHHAADQLHVEVALPERTLRSLAHDGERLGQQPVDRLALRDALAELGRLRPQRFIGQRRDLRLERVDALDSALVLLEEAVVATAEDLGEQAGHHQEWAGLRGEPAEVGAAGRRRGSGARRKAKIMSQGVPETGRPEVLASP